MLRLNVNITPVVEDVFRFFTQVKVAILQVEITSPLIVGHSKSYLSRSTEVSEVVAAKCILSIKVKVVIRQQNHPCQCDNIFKISSF